MGNEPKGNILKIKRGKGNPQGKLEPYELGYDTDGGTLYIGLPSGKATPISAGNSGVAGP